MVHKHREILNNRNAIFSLCEASCEAQFKPDVTSFFVGWCIYENFRSLLPRPWLYLMIGLDNNVDQDFIPAYLSWR